MPVSEEQAEQFGIPQEKLNEATMHSQFDILGTTIMAADNFHCDDLSYTGFSILLDLNSEDEVALKKAQAFWKYVLESGEVEINMPFEEQFWGGAMGDFIDKYGVRWLLHAQPYSKISK
ncbi:PhnB protein / putative DNA binding 3-demethylubiquinone-9 3-methyltransferase domain protein [Lactococcus sp. DD01]|nr:PhnB protein / putative DNA binding 3-demethylubiquinone-9 3-methyltransferase domain protein [Lactococcus sp. DD01]